MATTFADVAAAIGAYAPWGLQESYDNSGLLVGLPGTEVRGVILCLDVTPDVIEEAQRLGANLIVSHHPLIFSGLKRMISPEGPAGMVVECIRREIGVIAAHTNLDSTTNGVSYALGARLGLQGMQPLSPHPQAVQAGDGLGVVGNLKAPLPRDAFLSFVLEGVPTEVLRHSRVGEAHSVARVALCGGSGAELIGQAKACGADAYITADLKYHDFQRGGEHLLLLDVGHHESEMVAVELLHSIITNNFTSFAVCNSECEISPLGYYYNKN
ncbi:MAG: Nif3-like dinuclear metal center hexameric protein [Bacteroidetes bacterium]|nr:MAG: Nif3-like dinuclear metal center hexameric protein [Bacteroidota bacterium]